MVSTRKSGMGDTHSITCSISMHELTLMLLSGCGRFLDVINDDEGKGDPNRLTKPSFVS